MSKFRIMALMVSIVAAVSLSLAAQTLTSAPVRVSAAEQQKKLTKKVEPVYPKSEYDAKITGIIRLETTIGADGKVTNVHPIEHANDALTKAGIDAVKQWVYKPTKIDGVNVEVVTIRSI